MPDLQQLLGNKFDAALGKLAAAEPVSVSTAVEPAKNPEFGDYQFNGAMGLAKQWRRKPRDIAQDIVDALDLADVCRPPEIAGPGFVNLRFDDRFLARALAEAGDDDRLGTPAPETRRTVVVDYSSPNIAKEMHVGHLRSSIIGDAISRVLAFAGHRVIRQNHVGDWGTQFGMLIEHLIDQGWDGTQQRSVADLDVLYREAKQRDDADAEFAQRARQRVVALQSGDETTVAVWRGLMEESKRHFNAAYRRLGLLLDDGDIRGESFYNPRLAGVLEGLDAAGMLEQSQGADVVPVEGFTDREGNPVPLIVRKQDGGYLYATTDLAAARYRVAELGADELIYVVDARQGDHFRMLFQALRTAGWAPPAVRLEHVAFGMVLGEDGKPFKTRDGGTVKLSSLIDSAVERARAVTTERSEISDPALQQRIAEAVGIGALKYADLSSDRRKNYVFSLERMLSFDGNTAPYLQNAYVRVRSIFRKGEVRPAELAGAAIHLSDPAERDLGLRLLRFPETIRGVAESLELHRLCTYLYETAAAYHRFYERCPVLVADTEALRLSRLRICDITARTLAQGLDLLGIRVTDRM